jgi:hypothetical protein
LQGPTLALSGYSLHVIASEAKQSISLLAAKMDCFVANAPLRKRFAFVAGNDGGESGAQ